MATISNGESGSSVRTKLNEIINKVEGVTSIDNDITVSGTLTSDGLTVDGSSAGRVTLGQFTNTTNAGGTEAAIALRNQATGNADVSLVAYRTGANFGSDFYIETSDGVDGTNRKRLNVGENGDISFYEDTGTTAKFVWSASEETLSIGSGGTATPAANLIINDSATSGFKAKLTSSAFNADGNWLGLGMGYNNSYMKSAIIAEAKDSNARVNLHFALDSDVGSGNVGLADAKMTITYGGNVGIGTSSPSGSLDVDDASADAYVNMTAGSTTTSSVLSMISGSSSDGAAIGYNRNMRFGEVTGKNAAGFTERMRIGSTGTLTIGKTAEDIGTAGHAFAAQGYAFHTRDGNTPLFINRLTSDGVLAEFRKDGTTVGSIGVASNNLSIDTNGKAGLLFAANVILPKNNGAISDGTVDLGRDDPYRFKDLYLSGGVYLGGTGAANKLDDYEEGTWTATVQGVTTAGTATYGNRAATYTKVGNIVYVQCFINYSSFTGTGDMRVYGLPFLGESGSYETHPGSVHLQNISLPTGTVQVVARSQDGQAFIQLKVTKDNASETVVQCDAAGQIEIGLTYRSA